MKTGDSQLLQEMGRRVSRQRLELGMTQEQVAEGMDVSLQMISNLEQGKKAIRPENLVKLCAILQTSADYILTGKRSELENAELMRKFTRLSAVHQRLIGELIDSLVPDADEQGKP